MVKVTFTLDDETVAAIRRIARRLQKPQSAVIREAIPFYEPHAGQLSREERARRVRRFDEVVAGKSSRTADDVDAELLDVRKSRRRGWRRDQGPTRRP